MATGTKKPHCINCGKERSTSKCAGCSKEFCYSHLTEHRQELSGQLDEIEMNRDIFRQILNEQINNPKSHSLIKQIDQWEEDSIRKIQRTAKECREFLSKYTTDHINQMESNLAEVTTEIRQSRKENDFNEFDLNQFQQKLTQLSKELEKPSNISIQQESGSFINKISVSTSSRSSSVSTHINLNNKWRQNGITIAGGNKQGNQLNQLSGPHGIYVNDNDECIYIADYYNHRIVEWRSNDKSGEVVAGGNGKGDRTDQLNYPRDVIFDKRNNSLIICDNGNRRVVRWFHQTNTKPRIIISDIDCWALAMDNNGELYVSDKEKNEVRRWKRGDKQGTIVAGGNGKGNHLYQLNFPTYIFVDQDYSVYVSDCNNHRVMKWMKDATAGIVIIDGKDSVNGLIQLSNPYGLVVDDLDNVYVADSTNHRIICWSPESNECSIVLGGNGKGKQSNQFSYLQGLAFDREGNFYIVDCSNHRVQKFHLKSAVNRDERNLGGSMILSKFFKKFQ